MTGQSNSANTGQPTRAKSSYPSSTVSDTARLTRRIIAEARDQLLERHELVPGAAQPGEQQPQLRRIVSPVAGVGVGEPMEHENGGDTGAKGREDRSERRARQRL